MEIKGLDGGHGETDDGKGDDVKGGGDAEYEGVPEAMIQQPPGALAEDDAAHRATKPDKARHGADGLLWEKIGRQDHDQDCWPK